MKNTGITFILLILIAINLPLFAQKAIASDIELYRKTISEKHKNPFLYISKNKFDKQIDRLVSNSPKLNKAQVVVNLLKINAQISDEHTMVLPNASFKFPLKLKVFDDAVLIVSSDSIHKKLLLHKIVAINDKPIQQVLDSLKILVKKDNLSYTTFFQEYYINNTLILNGLGILEDYNEVSLKLMSQKGKEIKTNLPFVTNETNIDFENPYTYTKILAYKSRSNYWYAFDENNNVLYFNYQRCAENPDKPFSDFNKDLFSTIDNLKPTKFILDLRFNSGGNSSVLKPFIASIQQSYLNKNGRFYVLIGKKVMSSSLMNAIEIKKKTNAIFIGQPTGGNINHFGEITDFQLPHLNARVTYSTKYWENWKNHKGALKPDILASNTTSDFVNGIDRSIKTVYELRD